MAATASRINAATERLERLMEMADARMRTAIISTFDDLWFQIVAGMIIPQSATEVTASGIVNAADDPSRLTSHVLDGPALDAVLTAKVEAAMLPLTERAFQSGAIDAIIHLPDASAAYAMDPTTALPARVLNPLAEDHLKAARVEYKGAVSGVSTKVNAAIQTGFSKGEPITAIANRVQQAGINSMAAATSIARTQVVQASNAGAMAQARLFEPFGQVTKEWLSTSDRRTRLSHVRARGQEQPLDGKFTVGGWPLDFPGDPHGPPGEVRNCRCTVLFEEAPITDVLPLAEPRPVPEPRTSLEPLDVEVDTRAALANQLQYSDGVIELQQRMDREDVLDWLDSDRSVDDLLSAHDLTRDDFYAGALTSIDELRVAATQVRRSTQLIHPDLSTFFDDLTAQQVGMRNKGDWAGLRAWVADQIDAGELNVGSFKAGTRYFGFNIDDDDIDRLWTLQVRMARGTPRDLVPDVVDPSDGYRTFRTYAEQDEWWSEHFGTGWEKGRKTQVNRFLTNTSGEHDMYINQSLRMDWTEDEFNVKIAELTDQLEGLVQAGAIPKMPRMATWDSFVKARNKIAAIMDDDRSVLPEDLVMYRGLAPNPDVDAENPIFDAIDRYRKDHGTLVGLEIADKGYSSATLDPGVATRFAMGQGGTTQGELLAEKTADRPDGIVFRVLAPEGTHAVPIWNQATQFKWEREILINRCTTYRVISEDVVGVKGSYLTRLTVELDQGNCPDGRT